MLQNVFRVYYTNEDLSCPFRGYWGGDGMDAGGVHQMTCTIYRTRQPLGAPGSLSLFGTLGLFFNHNIYMYCSYNCSEPIQLFSVH